MINSEIYLNEVQKISERWEKRYDKVVTRSLFFLQINAGLLTLLFLIGNQSNSIAFSALIIPISCLLISAFFSVVTFFPLKLPEIQIGSIQYDKIDKDEAKVIYDSLIYEYLKKINSLRSVYKIKLIFFSCSIFLLLIGIVYLAVILIK